MKRRIVHGAVVAYYLAMVIFVTYPGYVPFDTIRPFVFGLPFSLFWQTLWICGSILALGGLFIYERRNRPGEGSAEGARPTGGDGGGDD
jgi:hypothetical protein